MVQCDSCESKDEKHLFNLEEYEIVQCNNCNLVYINNPLSKAKALEYYESTYNGDSCYGSGEQFRTYEANLRLDKIGNVENLLDIGCGLGFFMNVAEKRGINTIGVDISENAVKYSSEQGLIVKHGDLLDLDFLNKKFLDVITFWASIEHLYEPKATLKKAYELLKPNGLVVIETGDINSYQARLFKSKWRLILPHHNFYYSSDTLDSLLESTGFKTIKTEGDGFVESCITQMNLRKFVLNKFAQTSNSSKEKSSSLKERINSFAGKLRLGDVMIKYARKIN